MSKVICDICGTAFPETAVQCPICGSAKASSAQTAAGSAKRDGESTTAYTYVKGGRFSKANVRKRNGKGAASQKRVSRERQPQRKQDNQEETVNRALVAVVVLLLLAIVAVVIYIAVRFIGPTTVPNTDDNTKPSQTQATEPSNQQKPEIPCTALEILPVITLEKVDDTWLISVTKQEPADTTDKIIWTSADVGIATVSDTGLVTAVANGRTTITAKCGAISAECSVIVGDGSEEPTDGPSEPTNPEFELKFKSADVTLSKSGETWRAYDGTVSPLEITWVSDNPAVCTIENGVVTAVGAGMTEIHAQYNGQTATCIIRCAASVGEATKPTEPSSVTISHTDVTIKVGESFNLVLKDEGEKVTVEWSAAADGTVTIEGNKITGAAASSLGVKISTTYKENTYTCIVRVQAAE